MSTRSSVVALFFLIAPAFLFSSMVFAQDATELQRQIDEHSAKIKALETEIAQFQKELDATAKDRQTLQSTIKQLDISRSKLSATINLTQNKIDSTDLQIKQLGEQITDKEARIDQNSTAVASSLRELNQIDDASLMEKLLGAEKLSEIWNQVENIATFQGAVQEHIEALTKLKTDLEGSKKLSEQKKRELVALRTDLSNQKKALDANRADKNRLLAETKNKESEYQKLIAQKQALKSQFESQLFSIESKLKRTIDPGSLPRYGSGVLSWPLDKVRITQYFGNTPFSTANPQVYGGKGHNGIDIAASPGTPIKAALSGTVVGTGDTDLTCPNASYGRWVLIRHNNGLTTLYAHLSYITAQSGQSVSTGQVIGYSGNTGYSTGPHLHFTLYATQGVTVSTLASVSCKGKVYTLPISSLEGYLNPLSYL